MRPEKSPYATGLILWIIFFCFATSTALLFQKFLLPLFPALHAGQGLLDGDSAYHHAIAVELAEKIRLLGWSEWSLFPAPGATGNVGVLAILYVLFGNDPSLMIPINAAVHALSGVLIYLIAREVAPGQTGRIAGIIAAILFVGFPSALNWYGQIHKDGFSIAGVLLVVWAWLWVRDKPANARTAAILVASTLGGMALVCFVRPYILILLCAAAAGVFGLIAIIDGRDLSGRARKLALYLVSLSLLAAGAVWAKTAAMHEKYNYADLTTVYKESVIYKESAIYKKSVISKRSEFYKDRATAKEPINEPINEPEIYKDWRWKKSGWLPQSIEGLLEVAAQTRIGLIGSGILVQAGSMIDTDITPDNVLAVLAYAPRALQIALFSPFPAQWFEKISAVRLVSVVETLIWYLIAPGVVLAIYYRRSSRILMVMCFAVFFLYVFGFTIANVGTLYRVRYPFLFLFIVLGVVGWVELFLRRRASRPRPQASAPASAAIAESPPAVDAQAAPARTSIASLLSAGAIVALFTGLGYAGLFLRDIILARWFGVGAELDAFFLATTIPMFLVSVLSIPLGTMIVTRFLAVKEQASPAAAQRLVSKVAFVYVGAALIAAAALFATSAPLLQLLGSNFTPAKLHLSQSLLVWMLPILVLSGLVIMNNALLNALGRFTVASSAQIVVPVFSILALVLLGGKFGVVSVVVGLLVGQMINLWLVAAALAKSGYHVRPAWPAGSVPLRGALAQYLPLVTAALFVNLAVPVNIGMASTLEEGSVAALGLGTKIVAFITGLVSAGVATVILPHFSAFMARNRLLDVRNELSFFLLAATVITIPVSLVLFAGAEFIVRLLFEGGAFTAADVKQVTRVMSYGIIQLPFFTINLLVLNSAIATGHAWRVMTASLFALSVNVGLNLVLMQHSGVAGIALAASLSVAVSACFMLLLFNRLGHISWVDLVMIGLSWMLYTTLIISLQYHSYAGIGVTIIALVFLLYGQWSLLTRWRSEA